VEYVRYESRHDCACDFISEATAILIDHRTAGGRLFCLVFNTTRSYRQTLLRESLSTPHRAMLNSFLYTTVLLLVMQPFHQHALLRIVFRQSVCPVYQLVPQKYEKSYSKFNLVRQCPDSKYDRPVGLLF